MADAADQSVEYTDFHQELQIKKVREAVKKRELNPIGQCRWCHEPFEESSQQIFCPDGCQQDYEKAKRLKNPTL